MELRSNSASKVTTNFMTVQIVFESCTSDIKIDLDHGKPTVEHFARLVEESTGVPVANQRLIFKGKSLTDLSKTLDSYGLKSGSKVMVLGTKPQSPEDTEKVQIMDGVDKAVASTTIKLNDLTVQFEDIKKVFTAAIDQCSKSGACEKWCDMVRQVLVIVTSVAAVVSPIFCYPGWQSCKNTCAVPPFDLFEEHLKKVHSPISLGFLPAELQDEALTVLGRQLAFCIEAYTKELEKLDGLSLGQSAGDALRVRRKSIVVKIQGWLKQADELQSNISTLRSK